MVFFWAALSLAGFSGAAAGDPLPELCQGVGFAGCCQGAVLIWCNGVGLDSRDCSSNAAPLNTCGWDAATGTYDCGGVSSDPSGTYAKTCPVLDLDVTPEALATPECKVGTLVSLGCQDVSYQGCCSDVGSLLFCEGGEMLCELDCAELSAPNNTCGWHEAGASGYYDCGEIGADPTGVHLPTCPVVVRPEDVVDEDVPATSACPGIPLGGCCDGSVLHWCESGIEATFDCADLSSDPVFSAYVFCGTNETTDVADCLKKPDPSPPECGGEPLPDVVETVDVVEVASDLVEVLDSLEVATQDQSNDQVSDETVDTAVADSQGDGSPIVVPADSSPEQDDGKGGGGCVAVPASRGAGGGMLWMVGLGAGLWLLRRRYLRG